MSGLIYSKTEYAIVLAGYRDEKKVFQFYSESSTFPGVKFPVAKNLPIFAQLMGKSAKLFGLTSPAKQIHFDTRFSPQISLENDNATLFIATLTETPSNLETQHWHTMPALLRNMPSNRLRLSYLKAWQILQGMFEANIKVIEEKDLN